MNDFAYRYNIGLAYTDIVRRFGRRPMLRMPDSKEVSHQAFNSLANQFAALLSKRGIRRRDVIAIVHTKTISCYALMLGALKVGVAYVNLDDQNPAARLKHILNTARPSTLFVERVPDSVRIAAADMDVEIVELSGQPLRDELQSAPSAEPEEMPLVTGSDPAYIMYTSGSTGIPKGAIMTHANVLNFGAWVARRFGVGEGDVLTNVNPMYFDNSVFDFYGALLNGASIAPLPREIVADGPALIRHVERAGCTVWFSVPSLLIYLMTLKLLTPDRLPAIRSFVFGGEGYPKAELRKLHAAYGHRSRLINVYGPTECTCMCSAWDVTPADLETPAGLVTLGPIAENFSMLVLDGDVPVKPGETGELCLLGPQVGAGYVNDAERTAAAFVPNPTNPRWYERMYRTGDLVKLGEDGRTLDFVGRKDNQIKHMGYRIELEEIEAALNKLTGVTQSAVLHRTARRDIKILVAYVASESGVGEERIRNELFTLLPPYMIPQRIFVRRSLPKNANGKVDRIALAAEELE